MSFVIATLGITGLFIAARRPRLGWWFNLAAQPFWVLYAVSLRQWGLLVMTAGYTGAYVRLLRRSAHRPTVPASTRADG